MSWKLFYLFGCPGGHPNTKQGITSHPSRRLGSYQSAYSEGWHTAKFDRVYVGNDINITGLEKAVLNKFDDEIDHNRIGTSEWITGKTVEELEVEVDRLIDGYKFLVTKVDPAFLPLTIHNMDAFLLKYDLTHKSS